jgi:hypothetical protein
VLVRFAIDLQCLRVCPGTITQKLEHIFWKSRQDMVSIHHVSMCSAFVLLDHCAPYDCVAWWPALDKQQCGQVLRVSIVWLMEFWSYSSQRLCLPLHSQREAKTPAQLLYLWNRDTGDQLIHTSIPL